MPRFPSVDINIMNVAEHSTSSRAVLTPKKYTNVAGSTVFHSHDAQATHSTGTWTLMKSITLTRINGELKFNIDIANNADSPPTFPVYFEARVNSSMVAEYTAGAGYVKNVFQSQTFTQTLDIGDIIEIWGQGPNTSAICKNFRIIGTVDSYDMDIVASNA